jgi:hypothetical protein
LFEQLFRVAGYRRRRIICRFDQPLDQLVCPSAGLTFTVHLHSIASGVIGNDLSSFLMEDHRERITR